ncbi:hypothetical protein G7Y79_00026g059310 [Physcia stellaris]|nr:hypothetical protein G7Y79_00026g059310 [Physcia stellaris]
MLATKSTNPRLPAALPLPNQKLSGVENALPSRPPNFDRTVSEAPILSSARYYAESPPKTPSTSISDPPSQRPKKRVPWRNKTCIISIPLIDSTEDPHQIAYLKPEDVSQRLRRWQEQGYDVTGFVLASDAEDSGHAAYEGQSRAIYPDPVDEALDRSTDAYRVSIPDRLEWEAYVARLKEEKLRALGVSFGDDESPIATNAAIPTMSRDVSSQGSAMVVSPSLVPSNASNAGHHVNKASRVPFACSNNGSRIPSANSQAYQQPVQPHASHFPRYSTAMPNGNVPFNSSYSSSTPASTWPHNQQNGSQPGSRVMSPVINGQRLGINTFLSPASPVSQNNTDTMLGQDPRLLFAQIQNEQAHLQAYHLAQQQQQQQLLLANSSSNLMQSSHQMDELRPVQYSNQPEIASPIPRGHRQNLSETLQKEIENAQTSLTTTSIYKPGKEKKPLSLATGADDIEIESPSSLLEVGVLDRYLPDAEIETNPSLANSPFESKDVVLKHQPSHRSKPSMSGLNANALEFKPKEPAPGVFAFLGNQASNEDESTTSVHPRQNGSEPSNDGFNVEAPVFVPGGIPRRAMYIPSREFSFSSSGPAFKPNAPAFTPSDPGPNAEGSQQNASALDSNTKKIFGNIDYSEIIKPARKSKAIPIVKPEAFQSDSAADADGQEDESGRITQPEGRQKRLRRYEDDGDQVPLFATPPPATPPLKLGSVSPLSAASQVRDKPTPLENATHQLKEIIDEFPASDVSSLSDDTSAPFLFSNAQEAASFSTALPLVSPPIKYAKDEDPEIPHATLYAQEDFPIEPILTASSLAGRGQAQHLASSGEQEESPASMSSSGSSEQMAETQHDRGANDVGFGVTGGIRDFGRKPAIDGVTYIDPSLQEINEVMKHLNDEDSDLGVERNTGPWRSRSPVRSSMPANLESSVGCQMLPPLQLRSDAPSPSPNRLHGPYQYLPPTESESADTADVEMVARNARFSPSYRPSRSDVHRLNSPGSQSVSDWDDAILSVDEAKLQQRTNFFDTRVDEVVGNIVQQHMGPLEKTLIAIQASLTALSSRANSRRPRRTLSDEVEHSDADDEDDEEAMSSSRVKSPLRDRKFEKLRTSIQDIATAQQTLAPANQLAEVIEAVKELSTSVQQAPGSTGNIKTIVEEAIGRQLRGKSAPITSSHQSATAEKSQLQIAGLESMLKIAESRADDELKARRATEDALADSQRLLRGALQDAAEQRESAEETERSLAAYHEERHEGLRHTALLELSQESLQKTAAELSEKNAALEATLEEYRISSSQWRVELDDERAQNKDLNRTMDALRSELDEGIKGRETMRSQISRLQEDMAQMSSDVSRDQTKRHIKEEELKSKLEVLTSRLEAEARTRERLEADIDRLDIQEKEAMKARYMLEQMQRATTESEALVSRLRSECHEHQEVAARFEREYVDARESGKMEVQRIRTAMEADISMANNQANIARADLESATGRLQARLDDATKEGEAVNARYELMLEEASESRSQALREAAEAREAALQEHYRFHERTLGELRAEQERALSNAIEDKQRSETHLAQRLGLADEKVTYYMDKVTLLEEKLEIAKSAAHAAIQAAQANKPASTPSAATRGHWTKATGLPEKISPQALRESILVLQEQLQEREGRIEKLEQELSQTDRDAPAKLKDQDMEITWLRELLGVRIDELEDIIRTLSQPLYDREAVKDAAIRLKANLQMEQQEKERAMAGGQTFPSLASISNLAASPRALPLAAAAAWGNWRKAREAPFSSLSAMTTASADQTPSRSSPSAQSFLSGLLTPPSTSIRQTPPSAANGSISRPATSSKRPLRPYSTPRQSISTQNPSPVTPPLMRKASYDQDAESADFSEDRGAPGGADDQPFGPSLGSILSTT